MKRGIIALCLASLAACAVILGASVWRNGWN